MLYVVGYLMAVYAVDITVVVLCRHDPGARFLRVLVFANRFRIVHPLVEGEMRHGGLHQGISLEDLSLSQWFDQISFRHLCHYRYGIAQCNATSSLVSQKPPAQQAQLSVEP